MQWGRVAASLLFLLSGLAHAHAARNDVRVDMAALKVEGVVVEIHQDFLAPQFVVSNRSGKLLEILDAQGRAFLRIGPQKAEADIATEAFHQSRLSGGAAAPKGVLSATPRWRTVNQEPSFGWFDPRIATGALDIPYAIRQIGNEMPFAEWRIPARLGAQAIELRGVFTYTPPLAGAAIAKLLDVAPIASDVQVQLSPGPVPALFLRNGSGQTVAVLDDQGKPFLKISRDGVWADTSSPAWLDSGNAADVTNAGWQQISKSNSHSWLEPRAAWRGTLPAPLPADGVLNQWSIPLLLGEQRKTLRGVNQWVTRGSADAKLARPQVKTR